MSFTFYCPICNATMMVEENWVNQQISCPQCGNLVTVTKPEAPGENSMNNAGNPYGWQNQNMNQAGVPNGNPYGWQNQNMNQADVPNGRSYNNGVPPVRNEPGIALLLSFLIEGGGQLYNGQVMKGVIMLLISIITCGFLWLPVKVVSIIDAYKIAERINSGRRPGEYEMFWD